MSIRGEPEAERPGVSQPAEAAYSQMFFAGSIGIR